MKIFYITAFIDLGRNNFGRNKEQEILGFYSSERDALVALEAARADADGIYDQIELRTGRVQ